MSQIKTVADRAIKLRMTPVVDDDFPEMMHNLDAALYAYRKHPALPKVVCLCGSTRFYPQFQEANFHETMAGNIVLSVGFYPHSPEAHGEGVGITTAEKIRLDELHKRKIDLSDEVYVLNVRGYIGESTRAEIAYAKETFKPIRYLECVTAERLHGTRGEQ